jgi:hypothetical protein
MSVTFRAILVVLLSSSGVWAGQAAAPPVSVTIAAACAPIPAASLPSDPIRVIGAQDTLPRELFGTGDLLIVDAGADRAIELNQRFFTRRAPSMTVRHNSGPRGADTSGWMRVVAVTENTAIALVEYACDGILSGDVLQPYVEPSLPSGVHQTDAAGELDFSVTGLVLFGDHERRTGAAGDFMVTDVGEKDGAVPGARFAIYRDLKVTELPLTSIGEAVVVSVEPEFSLVRITLARDAILSGDMIVPRRRR